MHPYSKTLDQDRGSRYLQSHTTTQITGEGVLLEDANSSQERMVSPDRKRQSGIRKVTEYSVSSGQEVGDKVTNSGNFSTDENKKFGVAL